MEAQPGNRRRRSTISARFMKSSLRTTAWLAWTSRRPLSSKRTAWEYEAFAGPTISGHLSRTVCSFVGTPIPCFALRLSISSTSSCEGRLRMPRGSSDGIFLSEAIKSSAVLLNLWGSPCISLGKGMPWVYAGGKL
jgi:hypothetical protein